MEKFLESVARAHIERYGDLSDFLFVFPNKRAGTFFRRFLGEMTGDRWVVAPEIVTISNFVTALSGREVPGRLDLLFMLYKAYSGLISGTVDFERFRMWGEMALNDFNDVDMYEVDASELYKNLSDLNEIRTDYFTDEQREVLRDYFGVTDFEKSTGSFWLHYNNHDYEGERTEGSKKRFIELWKVLGDVYHRFNDILAKDGLAYSGQTYRLALDKLREEPSLLLDNYKRVVMVGFNALSTVEYHIFKELSRMRVDATGEPFADFYWDCTGKPMEDKDNSAVHFVRKNMRIFPSSLDVSSSDREGLPEVMKVISAPSNVAQTKVAKNIVADLLKRLGPEELENAKVAVVLPDESLLLPMMYSVPEEVEGVNLTIGYPMNLTPTVTFVGLLRRLQYHKRLHNDEIAFYYEDVRNLLSHPYVQRVGGKRAVGALRDAVNREHRFMVPLSRILQASRKLAPFFSPLDNTADASAVIEYIDGVLSVVEENLEEVTERRSLVKERLDVSHVRLYRRRLVRLKSSLEKYDIKSGVGETFSLIDRLIRGESVRFEGEPLTGLQVMGPLETRCLDFDYLIILSMNERIYPRKLQTRTFIPNSLRLGFGMSTTRFQESIFAYNFYRMISRAKEVYMVYDARTQGVRSGDVSRYIQQLSYLYAPGKLFFENFSFRLSKSEESIEVRKTEEIMDKIKLYFTPGSGKYFSASSLTAYLRCPLKFYLERVRNLSVEDDPEEFMRADVLGTVLHSVLQNFYTPDRESQGCLIPGGREITGEYISNGLASPILLETYIRRAINKAYYLREDDELDKPLEKDGEVYAAAFMQVVRLVLAHDKTLTPFRFFGSEVKFTHELPLSDGTTANMKVVIDRLDNACVNRKQGDDDGDDTRYRIVDYKSGGVHLNAEKLEDITMPETPVYSAFQLLLYAYLLSLHEGIEEGIRTEIYKLTSIAGSMSRGFGFKEELPRIDGIPVKSHKEVEEGFSGLLEDILMEIKDPSKPFRQCSSSSASCSYCNFRKMCRR